MAISVQETLFESGIMRLAAGVALFARALCYRLLGRQYRALEDLCRIVRTSNNRILESASRAMIFRVVRSLQTGGENWLARAYQADSASAALAAHYSMSGRGKGDFFRDLIVLKKYTREEKGVILLKYARTFSAIVALFDVPKLMERYTFVLEPCWAGYCHPSILMLLSRGNPIIVQCFTEEDFRYIESIGAPLVPIRQGPADWVDAEVFAPPETTVKTYDLVMVANWGAHKRHAQLFRALREISDRPVRVLLAGFAWAGRTAGDIRRESKKYPNERVQIEILENVPHSKLAGYVSQSKVFVFLTRKEGDNKALVEAMFADVPAIVYDRTIGGAGSRVNSSTGVFSSDSELARKIVYMLDNYRQFAPRAWALEHTGSSVATRRLDAALREAVSASGGQYTTGIVEKINGPNLAYKDPARRADFADDYEYIRGCARLPARPAG